MKASCQRFALAFASIAISIIISIAIGWVSINFFNMSDQLAINIAGAGLFGSGAIMYQLMVRRFTDYEPDDDEELQTLG